MQKMASPVSENQDQLDKELTEAVKKGVWDENEATFVKQLIKTGSLEKSKIDGRVPVGENKVKPIATAATGKQEEKNDV